MKPSSPVSELSPRKGLMAQTPGLAAISFLEDSDDDDDPAVYDYWETIPTLMATAVGIPLTVAVEESDGYFFMDVTFPLDAVTPDTVEGVIVQIIANGTQVCHRMLAFVDAHEAAAGV